MNRLPSLCSLFLILVMMVWALLRLPLPLQSEVDRARMQAAYQHAETLRREMKLAAAIEHYQKLRTFSEARDGVESLRTARILNQLGLCYKAKGSYSRAELLLQRSLYIREASLGRNHSDVAESLNSLANLYFDLSQYSRAEPLVRRALAIREARLGPDHSDVATSLTTLAQIYRATSRYADAEPLYQRVLAIRQAKLGKDHPDVACALNNLAGLYWYMGQYTRAEPLFQRALTIREAALGGKHVDVAESLNNLAMLYLATGQPSRAEPLLQRSLHIWETVLGKDHPAVATNLNNLANVYQRLGQYANAEPLYQRSLKIREAVLGRDHPDVAAALNNLAYLYQTRKRYAEAEPLYLRAISIWEAKLGKDHFYVANALGNLAAVYRAMVQYPSAESLFQRALAICEARLGKDHLSVAALSNDLANLYHDMGEYAKAEPLHRRALAIREAQLGNDDLDVALSLHNLAALYRDMGRYADAEPLCQRALAIREKKLGTNHLHVAASLDNLARICQTKGQYTKAESLYQRALAIREANLGMGASVVGFSLNNLASLYQNMGQYTKAEPLYQRALAIQEVQLPKDHPEVATILGNLARLYYAMRQFDKAETLCKRALAIQEAQLGAYHPTVAGSLDSLAVLYWRTDQPDRAEPLFQRSLAIRETKYGKDHPAVAISLNNLALVYSDMGKYTQAEPLLQRSLATSEARFGDSHPDVATTLYNLGLLRERQGRTHEAVALFESSRRSVARHVARVLPILAESEQLAFLQNKVECPLHVALSLAAHDPDDPKVTTASAGWLLNSKGIAQQTLAHAALLARESKDPDLADLTRQLLDVRQQLARLAHAGPQPGQRNSLPRQLQELNAREDEIGDRLRRAGSSAVRAAPWVELQDVRRKLPADGIFIDVTRMPVLDFQAKKWKDMWAPVRYIAWLTRAEGDSYLVDLGSADRIDAAIRDVRKALEAAPRFLSLLGEAESERRLRKPLDALSRLVLHPLLKNIDASRNWIISPDGNLWLVPWEALTLPDGTYAIERHQITYVVSGRDLVSSAGRTRGQLTPPLVLADPDFDLGFKEVMAETRRLLPEGEGSGGLQVVSRSFVRGRVQRLLGTAEEARAITPLLKRYAGVEPRVYLGRQALEGVFKASRSPRVVVLSTHGFFLPDQDANVSEETLPPGLTEMPHAPGKASESPLLRCGLLLAGCNSPTEGVGGDDGVLTGLEVVDTDLRGTELVVLSACQTGLGEVRNGEGVAGLRQAFQLAGAEAVLATLWPVADKESAQLMSQFFDNLANGQSKPSALHNAQLQMIAVRRNANGAAHPFFWAAYTLTSAGD